MKIGLLTLTRGSVSGGFRKYLDRLVPLLSSHREVERLDVFVPLQMARRDWGTWPGGDDLRGFPALVRSLKALDPDVIFIPTARFLRVDSKPTVTMVRNMEPLEVPFGGNTLAEGLKNVARAVTARTACRRADRIIAVSNHVRDFLIERWRIPSERLGLVYHGIDPVSDVDPEPPAVLRSLADRRFIFTAGSIRPARGLEDAIRVIGETPADVTLVIAGTIDRGAESYGRRMRLLASELGVSSRLLWCGQLDETSIAWCFRRAEAFLMTSRAEACPNIVLEALANGAISVSTNHSPMPEFFADSALYYRERDASHLGVRIREVLAWGDTSRSRLRDAARARAAQFSWESTARSTVIELQRAVART